MALESQECDLWHKMFDILLEFHSSSSKLRSHNAKGLFGNLTGMMGTTHACKVIIPYKKFNRMSKYACHFENTLEIINVCLRSTKYARVISCQNDNAQY